MLIHMSMSAQSVESEVNFQIDEIVSTTLKYAEYVFCFHSKHDVYIICRTNDSLYVTSYFATASDKIHNAYSIILGQDTSFTNSIDALYSNVNQTRRYRLYSKTMVGAQNFLLAFKKDNEIQIFYQNLGVPKDLEAVDSILLKIDTYVIVPYNGSNKNLRALEIGNWGEMMKYFKTFNYRRKAKQEAIR
jgi:hypothetical protein